VAAISQKQKEENMKKALARIFAGLVLAGSVLMVNPTSRSKPAAVFAEGNGCRLTALNGTYGFAFNGYFGSSAPFTPLAAAGTITFHPDGTVKRAFDGSFGGALFSVNDSGSYTVNQDCTFTAGLPEAGETWNLIPVEAGLQIEFFVNTSGRVGAGTMTHQ
jgi:hypothetical protein